MYSKNRFMDALTLPRTDKAIAVISAVTFIGFLDTHLLIPIISLYASEKGAAIGTVGLIVGLYSITNTPANIFLGKLVDRFGYKRPLILGLIGDALGMFLYTLCGRPWHLALVRVLHGLFGGVVGPATMSGMVQHGSDNRHGRAMAFYGISLASATLVGYGLSGLLASRLGYGAVFMTGAGLLLVGAVLTGWLPGGRPPETAGRQSRRDGWRQIKQLLGKKGLVASYCGVFAQYFSFGGVVTLLPLYVKDLGLEAFHVGMLLAAFAVMFIVVQFTVGSYSDRKGRLRPALYGMGLGTVALVLLPNVVSFYWLLALMAVYGVAFGMIFPSISAMVADQAATGERGLATGIFHALLTSGVAVGAPLLGWAGAALGITTGLMLSAALLVLALLIVLAVVRRI